VKAGDFRRLYIEAMQAANQNEIGPLMMFARS